MGKTPERGTYRAPMAKNGGRKGQGGGGLWYRRKAPASAGVDGKAAAGEDNQRDETPAVIAERREGGEDNQSEHEQPVAVAPLAQEASRGAGASARDAKKYKKKHKTRPASGDKALPSDGGKKDAQRLPKRAGQGDDDGAIHARDAVETVELQCQPKTVAGVEDPLADEPAMTEVAVSLTDAPPHEREPSVERHKKHKPKQFARKEDKTTKRRPKQLQWKVKAQQPTAPIRDDSDAALATPASDTTSQANSESKTDADSADEEKDFATHERQLLKLRAKAVSFPTESSSQETQSGSDDDSAMFLHFSRPPVPLPSIAVQADKASEQAQVAEGPPSADATGFPAPFPLERVAALAPANVHEILLRDFAFHPPTLEVAAGEVVVWRVGDATPRMVEHCLDVTLVRTRDAVAVTASTPTLGAGDVFAWRFGDGGAATVACSVYDVRGSIVVHDAQVSAPERAMAKKWKRAKTKKQKKSQRVSEAELAALSSGTALQSTEAPGGADGGVVDASEQVDVFHCPPELLRHGGSPDMDAGLCHAVLSQLDAVSASAIVGVNASSSGVLPVIVVGDVECPISEERGQEADAAIASDSPDDTTAVDEVADFQERVIAMLRRSEEAQAEQRRSFVVGDSGFDALRAYDFFKRRFTDVQAGCGRVVYL